MNHKPNFPLLPPTSQSIWDKIFAPLSESPLTQEEQERAFAELAQAVRSVEEMRASPAHRRVKELITAKMTQSSD